VFAGSGAGALALIRLRKIAAEGAITFQTRSGAPMGKRKTCSPDLSICATRRRDVSSLGNPAAEHC
jgi:hypothetical protein